MAQQLHYTLQPNFTKLYPLKKYPTSTFLINGFLLFTLLFLFANTHAQTLYIKGKITDEKSGLPIEYASVFFAHSTVGTATKADGTFSLKAQKQQALNLIVSHISYYTIEVSLPHDRDTIQLTLSLKPNEHLLQSIEVRKNTVDRNALLNTFKESFFGKSSFGYACKIDNPDVLDFISQGIKDFPSWQLTAFCNGQLEYTNKALGYKVKYTLVDFYANYYQITYFGYPLYEDVLDEFNEKRVLKNRRKAYEGSKLHFFRALVNKRLEEEGFEVYKIDIFNKDKADFKNYGLMEDSVFIGQPGVVMLQTEEKLDLEKYVHLDYKTGIPELSINEPFEVRYVKAKEERGYQNNSENFRGMNNQWGVQTTIVRIKEGKIQFYRNGSLDNSSELMTIGYWSYKRMGDFLPFDYNFDYKD